MADWYRRKTWTKIDEEEFYAKLSRARKGGRAQYLKIQAIELVDTKEKVLLEVAEALLHKMLNDYPDDIFNRASAFHTLGDIAKLNENYELAIDQYKRALDFEMIHPNIRTQAFLDYCELVVKTNKNELYDHIEKIMLERYSHLVFPIQKYKVNSLLSIINQGKGQFEKAKKYAELAEASATAETSGLRYHKYLGVVNNRLNWLDHLVKKK